MSKKSWILLPITLLMLYLSSFATAADTTVNLSTILPKVMPAVVNIAVRGEITVVGTANDTQGQGGDNSDDSQSTPQPGTPLQPVQRPFESLGSGVVIDSDHGYIVTNAHVINQAKTITVTLDDGRKLPAKLIGADPLSDIAILQIKANNLKTISLANSDTLKIGEPVAAIGNPFGLSQTVTSGIISGLQRTNLHIENYENFIQTDASINPGNSGGALVNMQGQLIGINTAILTPGGGNIGIGFAIPSNMVRSVMAQLIQYGAVKRGVMGILLETLTPELAHAFHVDVKSGGLVTLVTPGSPASKAGIQAGDIILKVNDRDSKDAGEIRNIVGLLRVGANVKLEILRGNKILHLMLVTADPAQYQQENAVKQGFLYGVDLQDFDQVLSSQGHLKGVIVVGAKPDTAAWRSGLRPGDLIVSANRINTNSVQELLKAVQTDKTQLLLNIIRSNGATFIVINNQ